MNDGRMARNRCEVHVIVSTSFYLVRYVFEGDLALKCMRRRIRCQIDKIKLLGNIGYSFRTTTEIIQMLIG